MTARRPVRPIVNRTNYELAQPLAGLGAELLELRRRFDAEEARLTAALGPDEPPTFADFVAWITERGSRPPHRPRGRPERPAAMARRSTAQRQRRERERRDVPVSVESAAA